MDIQKFGERVVGIEMVVVGKRSAIELVVVACSARYVLIEDVPGVGKTMLLAA
jgi:MoxR-like ATPase